jgi:glutaredoxin 3
MEDAVIYVTETCPYCIKAKKFLTEKQISFKVIDLTEKPEELAKLKSETGWQTVPQIFFKGKFIGGYTDMVALDNKGELV